MERAHDGHMYDVVDGVPACAICGAKGVCELMTPCGMKRRPRPPKAPNTQAEQLSREVVRVAFFQHRASPGWYAQEDRNAVTLALEAAHAAFASGDPDQIAAALAGLKEL